MKSPYLGVLFATKSHKKGSGTCGRSSHETIQNKPHPKSLLQRGRGLFVLIMEDFVWGLNDDIEIVTIKSRNKLNQMIV